MPRPQGEAIYDWLECTLTDGSSLAIARDVTELLPAPDPDPAYSAAPPHMPQHTDTAQAAAVPFQAPPVQAPSPAASKRRHMLTRPQ